MKKYTLLFAIFWCITSTNAQDINTEITLPDQAPFLLGMINKDGLKTESYNDWFSKNYDDYELDPVTIEHLKSKLSAYQITIFMGTWCGDSKREVPRFYKILDACNFPPEQLTVIALSRAAEMYKQSPKHYEAGLNIHRVPTFIFYKDKQEVNRIVEHPVETLEKDILNIINSAKYKPNYEIVSTINNILKTEGLNGLKKQKRKILRAFSRKVSSMSELNTYARILYTTNRLDEAIEVCEINNKLFPESPRTYSSLAIVLNAKRPTEEAIRVIENAVKKFPENEDLKLSLKSLKNEIK